MKISFIMEIERDIWCTLHRIQLGCAGEAISLGGVAVCAVVGCVFVAGNDIEGILSSDGSWGDTGGQGGGWEGGGGNGGEACNDGDNRGKGDRVGNKNGTGEDCGGEWERGEKTILSSSSLSQSLSRSNHVVLGGFLGLLSRWQFMYRR
jgi:hypothetical protein